MKTLVFGICALHSITASGLIFAYPLIAKALIDAGQYAELCSTIIPCPAQSVKFGLIYVVGNAFFFVGSYAHGILLDELGPRFDSTFATSSVCLGSLLTALSNSGKFDAFMAGCVLIGFGGSGVHLSFFHVSNLFKDGPTIQSAVVGAVVLSAIVYVIFSIVINSGVNKSIVFGCHTVWLFLLCIVAALVQPSSVFRKGQKVIIVYERFGWCFEIKGVDNKSQQDESIDSGRAITNETDKEIRREKVAYVRIDQSIELAEEVKDTMGGESSENGISLADIDFPDRSVPAEATADSTVVHMAAEAVVPSSSTTARPVVIAGAAAVSDKSTTGEAAKESGAAASTKVSSRSALSWVTAGFVFWTSAASSKAISESVPAGLPSSSSSISSWQMMQNPKFLMGLLFLVAHAFRFTFYTATILINIQYYKGGRGNAKSFLFLLFLFLPLGFAFQPVVNKVVGRWGIAGGFMLTNALGGAYGVLMVIPILELQVLTFILVSFHRMSLFSVFYPYVMKVCGPRLFGTMSGFSLLVVGMVSAIQYGLILLIERFGHGNYFIINLLLFPLLPLLFTRMPQYVRWVYDNPDAQ